IRVTCVSDWEAAGYSWCAVVCIKVEGRPPRAVADEIAQFPEVFGLALVHGRFDLVVHIFLLDRDELHAVMKERLAAIPGVRQLSLNFITDVVGFGTGTTTSFVGELPPLDFPAPRVPLDEIDLGLIEALAKDGRQSNREVGRQLGVSEGTIRSRLRRLED